MMSLPKVGRGRIVVFMMAALFAMESESLWAADKVANKVKGDKAALLDRSARTSDPVYLLKSLEERRLDLDKRARWLETREADLTKLEQKLSKRIAALERLREDLRADLAKESSTDDANIAHLSKIFSGMKVKAAANGLRAMDQETAVLVLKVMPEKIAAKILSKMESSDAVKLANALGMPQSEKHRR